MNIVIIGAGQVGSSLASNLSTEDNDIVVIDSSTERLRHLREQLDIDTCYGNGAHPAVQEDANVGQADMLVAVTSSDEVNMLACQVAYQLHHTPTRIARVRSSSYLNHAELFSRDAIPVDRLPRSSLAYAHQTTRRLAKAGSVSLRSCTHLVMAGASPTPRPARQALILLPEELISRTFQVLIKHGKDTQNRGLLSNYGAWASLVAQRNPELALSAVEAYLGYVKAIGPSLYIYDRGDNFSQLLTRLFAEAEEREESDQGNFLRRVVALQDSLLALGMNGINNWLKAAERP